jgi:hypothetical protein
MAGFCTIKFNLWYHLNYFFKKLLHLVDFENFIILSSHKIITILLLAELTNNPAIHTPATLNN